jgi:hypothetical protein
MQKPRLPTSPVRPRLHARLLIYFARTHSWAGKASFNWIDPLLLDQQLTEEERMVRDSAEQFAQDKLAPRVLEAFRHEKTDPAIFP